MKKIILGLLVITSINTLAKTPHPLEAEMLAIFETKQQQDQLLKEQEKINERLKAYKSKLNAQIIDLEKKLSEDTNGRAHIYFSNFLPDDVIEKADYLVKAADLAKGTENYLLEFKALTRVVELHILNFSSGKSSYRKALEDSERAESLLSKIDREENKQMIINFYRNFSLAYYIRSIYEDKNSSTALAIQMLEKSKSYGCSEICDKKILEYQKSL